MGLDAVVFCDCYERGRTKRVPSEFGLLDVQRNGALEPRSGNPEMLDQFDAWRRRACRHEEGMMVGESLGNATQVGELRDALRPKGSLFPILLGKVIYSGSHTGDYLSPRDVAKLAIELDRLKRIGTSEKTLDRDLQTFRRKLEKLVRVALKIKKPIAF